MRKRKLSTMTAFAALLMLAACNQDEGPEEMNPNPQPDSGEEDSATQEGESMNSYITINDAIERFNEVFPDASMTGLKYDAQSMNYEIDGIDDDSEYELIINVETQEEVSQETEALDQDDAGGVEREREAIDTEGLIEPNEAVQTAHDEIDGAMRSWELERDDNRTYYEVKIEIDQDEHEVKVDAQSGDIIEIDRD